MRTFLWSAFFCLSGILNSFSSNDSASIVKAKNSLSGNRISGFQENKGQVKDMNGKPVPSILFRSETPGMNLYITETGLTYVLTNTSEEEEVGNNSEELFHSKDEKFKIEWSSIELVLANASIRKENVIKSGQSSTQSQYFYAHCPEGVSDVRSYEKVTISNVYPRIDWVFYNSSKKGFKYDFIVHAGANPEQIQLLFRSKEKLALDHDGNILFETNKGMLTEKSPYSYIKETNADIKTSFKLISEVKKIDYFETAIKFNIEKSYDRLNTLVIDPQLTWGTFFGGATAHEGAQSITCDPNGDITIVGYLASTDFPLLNPANGNFYQGTNMGNVDAYIIKFSNAGVQLWATYYGGTGGEEGNYVTNDAAGNIYVTGYTSSTDFPIQNAGGGSFFQGTNGGSNDAYILKFNNTGARIWATYYGGSGTDMARSIDINQAGNIFITGFTESTNFPVLNKGGGAFYQPALGGSSSNAFVLEFTSTGVPVWATYLGGNVGDGGMSLSLDNNNNLFVVGYTRSLNFPILNPGGGAFFQAAPAGSRSGFITKFSNTGVIIWSTFYGGSSSDVTSNVAVDANGNVFICGTGYSSNLTLLNPGGGVYYQAAPAGGNEIFLLKFTNNGVLAWGTHYGGSIDESFYNSDHLLIDNCDNVYLGFETNSTDVPVKTFCSIGFNDATLSGTQDLFLAKFSNAGVHIWGTYLGGDGNDFSSALAFDNSGNLFMAGEWTTVPNSATYPLVNPGGGAYFDNTWAGGIDDSYVVKFEPVVSTPSATSTSAGCNCSGTATATIPNNGCSGPTYTYAWSNGTTTGPITGLTSTISNLCPGNYSVVITYGACSTPDTLTYSITGTAGGFTLTVTPTNAICSTPNGSATANLSGGSSPFTYSWSNGQSTSAISGLAAGSYTCNITDASGCTNTQTFSITSTGGYSVNITPTNAICSATNGSATVTPTGGTAPFTYLWNNGQSSSAAIALATGTYTCIVTDSNGCSNTQTVSISSSGNITSAVTSTTASCNGLGNGTATISPSSGTAPFTYNWSGGQSTSAINNLTVGIYSATVTDANGCSSTQTVSISQPNAITASVTNTAASCNASDGTATVSSQGGTGTHTYLWSNGQSSLTASGLAAGNYSVTITDANGCTINSTTNIVNSNGPTALASGNINIQLGSSATLTASGGVTYSWTPTTGLNNSTIANPAATPTVTTKYCVFVYDANGCFDSACVLITVTPEPIVCGEFYIPNAFSPNGDNENDVFKAYIDPSCVLEFKLVIYNRWGEKVFEANDVTQTWDGKLKGEFSNSAVYTFYCKAKLTNGKDILKEGNVSLVR